MGVIICTAFMGLNVSAKTVTITQENFDYDWYLKEHPDVAAAVGYDQQAIWNYYINLGEPAGWLGRPIKASLTGRYQDITIDKLYGYADDICNNYQSQYDRTKQIHDTICDLIDYDYSYSARRLDDVFTQGVGVCEGYSNLFDILSQLCGIDSSIVSGVAFNGYSSGGHAWNKVIINGQESYVDCTWDDFTKDYNYIAHDCFMISENRMNEIHNGQIMHFVNGVAKGYY